jgi:hypothetical protein
MTNDFKRFQFGTDHLKMNPALKNLAATQSDYALFLPSISAIYAKIVSMTNYRMRDEMPKGLPKGLKDLDYLDPANSLFYYPVSLYSAGHAILDPADSWTGERMVMQRDRSNTVIVGDSGGFQAATGVLKYPWHPKNKQSPEDHAKDQDDVRMKLLRWLEATADYSMVLDWPTYALVKYGLDPVTGASLHPALKTFGDCLTGSLENHEFFIKHRKEGATKFLNVLQGRNEEEGDIWWDATKDLPFESWAFSNVQASNFSINLRRLIIMRDEHYLEGREWLHYLGNGKIKAGCALTSVQRALRKYVDPNLTVSFDAASPFVMTAKGQMYYGHQLSAENVGFKGGPIVDKKELKNNPQLLNDWIAQNLPRKCVPVRSKIGELITVGDICVRGYEDLEHKRIAFTKKEIDGGDWAKTPEGQAGDPFKWSNAYREYLTHHHENGGLFDFGGNKFDDEKLKYQIKYPSSMDGFSYLLAMNHNTELHINAIQAANHWQDQPVEEAKNYLTSDLLEFKDLCPEIFTSERPMDLINKHAKMLQQITGMDADNQVSMDFESF